LDQLREKENLFDEHSFILPLSRQEDRWRATGFTDKKKSVHITYNAKSGLELTYE